MTKRIYAPTDDAGQLARYSEIESYLSDATDLFDPEGLVFIRFAEVKDTDTPTERLVFHSEDEVSARLLQTKMDTKDGQHSEIIVGSPQISSPRARFLEIVDSLQNSSFKPPHGWAELQITFKVLRIILSSMNSAFLEFFRFLTAFGYKSHARDEGFGGFDYHVRSCSDGNKEDETVKSLEVSYLIKYVAEQEEKDDRPGSEPWSIRHALVYQKFKFETRQSDHILVRLSPGMGQRLGKNLSDSAASKCLLNDWTRLHSILWLHLESDFRSYANYLDEGTTEIYKRILLSRVDPTQFTELDSPKAVESDMGDVQFLEDRASRLASIVKINLATIKSLKKLCKKLLPEIEDKSEMEQIEHFLENLRRWKREHMYSLLQLDGVAERIRAVSKHLRDTVALRNNEITRFNSRAINNNANATHTLAKRTSYEGHVVKVLTVLALVFVPASFVADFLQMGYIETKKDEKFTLVAKKDLQIYAALALPLLAVIMGIYVGLELWNQQRYRAYTRKQKDLLVKTV